MGKDQLLSGKDIRNAVYKKLEEYKTFNFLEQYAMYMGKAQILELGLKGLLTRKYSVPFDSMEKWSLGRVKDELERKGLRKDFIAYLESVLDYRNYIAHELLVNNSIISSLANFSNRKLYGDFFRGVYELEQILILFNW